MRGSTVTLPGSTPSAVKSRRTRSRAAPGGVPSKARRDPGSCLRISAQSLRTERESFAVWLNEPNVKKPWRSHGGAPDGSIETNGR